MQYVIVKAISKAFCPIPLKGHGRENPFNRHSSRPYENKERVRKLNGFLDESILVETVGDPSLLLRLTVGLDVRGEQSPLLAVR